MIYHVGNTVSFCVVE